jgi:hypothetical protein
LQIFDGQISVAHDAFQDFWVENFGRVERPGCSPAGSIPVNLVATALAGLRRPQFFEYRGHLARCDAGQLRH